MVNAMAKEYGKLPSEVLRNATSFDFRIFITNRNYEIYRSKLGPDGQPPTPELTDDQMKELLESVR